MAIQTGTMEVGRDGEALGTLTVHADGTLTAQPLPGIHPDEAATLRQLAESAREDGVQALLAVMPRWEDRWRRREGWGAHWVPGSLPGHGGEPPVDYARSTLPAPPGSLTAVGPPRAPVPHPVAAAPPHPLSGSAPVALHAPSGSAPVALPSGGHAGVAPSSGLARTVPGVPLHGPPAAAPGTTPTPAGVAFDPLADWRTPLPAEADVSGWAWKPRGADSVNPTFRVTDPKTGAVLIAKAPAHAYNGTYQPAQVATELAAANIHQLIGTPNVPGMGATTQAGRRYLLSRLVSDPSGTTAAHNLGDEFDRNGHLGHVRLENSPEDFSRLATANWLLGAQDRHVGNYLVGPNKALVPIDYGMSFHPHPDTDMIPAKPDALRDPGAWLKGEYPLAKSEYPLDRAMLRRIGERRPEIEREVEALAAHYGDRAADMRGAMRQRLDRAAELADHPDPRVGHLKETPAWILR